MIPKLRFSEFTESWNEVSIGDIATISRGRFSPRPRNDPRYYGGDTEFIQTSEVVGANPNILNGSKSLNKEGVKVSKVFPSGTIVMTIAANIGYVGFANRPVAFPDSLVGISAFEDILPKYIYYSLSRKQRRLDYIAEEAAQKNITSPTVRKFKIWHTRNQQEQVTLTNFFDLINLKINLLTKKKEVLETYKKGLMQKIFSQELRFNRENGTDYPEWERKELIDIMDYEQPTKYIVDSTEYSDHFKTPVLTAGKTFILGFTDEDKNHFTDFPVIIFDDFTTAFKFVDFAFKVKSSAMKILRPRENVNVRFVYEAMKIIRFPKGEHKRYWISEYCFMKIPFPSEEEQHRIAALSVKFDQKTDAVDRELATIQKLKKGLLQQMFV